MNKQQEHDEKPINSDEMELKEPLKDISAITSRPRYVIYTPKQSRKINIKKRVRKTPYKKLNRSESPKAKRKLEFGDDNDNDGM